MRQAGQSKKMEEARLSFEECKTIFKWYLKWVYVLLTPSVYIYTYTYTYAYTYTKNRKGID